MPAASDRVPDLPHTFRPLGVRLAIVVLGTMLLVVVVAIWFAFPPEVRAAFTLLQITTVLVLGGLFYAAGYALARSRVVARPDGVVVVNGYRSHRFEWNEVLAVTLKPGGPWAVIDLSDGTTLPAMGIQGSDGPRAQRQVRTLRRLVDAHTA